MCVELEEETQSITAITVIQSLSGLQVSLFLFSNYCYILPCLVFQENTLLKTMLIYDWLFDSWKNNIDLICITYLIQLYENTVWVIDVETSPLCLVSVFTLDI